MGVLGSGLTGLGNVPTAGEPGSGGGSGVAGDTRPLFQLALSYGQDPPGTSDLAAGESFWFQPESVAEAGGVGELPRMYSSALINFKTATSFSVVAAATGRRFWPLAAIVEFTDVVALTVGPSIEIGNNGAEDNVAPALPVLNTVVADDFVPFVMATAPVIIDLNTVPITGHLTVQATATNCFGHVHLIGTFVS